MKKALLAIIVFFAIVLPVSSENSSHLVFRDISMDRSLTEFVEGLTRLGYKLVSKEEGCARMQGEFVNRGCEVFIHASARSEKVWRVVVKTPVQHQWTQLRSDYNRFKNLYMQKYGAPRNVLEFFVAPYREGDGQEMTALHEDRAQFKSLWKTYGGEIMVEIIPSQQIVFSYEDKINASLAAYEEKGRLTDEDARLIEQI